MCDILAYAPDVLIRSTWSTIASPRFNIYERDRSCDDLNSLNLESEAPRSRILTGKKSILFEDFMTQFCAGIHCKCKHLNYRKA